MNTFKFRAWDHGSKKFILEVQNDRIPTITTDKGFSLKTKFELTMWIGVVDKNKLDIYQGDIVIHMQQERSKKKDMHIVTWDAGGFIFKDVKGQGGHRPFINGDGWCPYIVIGNIYANPELLK